MITCVRKIQFCAGHRLLNHEGKCKHLHGHNYVGFFYAVAEEQDACGRVIDFSVLKERIGGWIDKNWDHGMILNTADEVALMAVITCEQQKLYTLPFNPTAENMAKYLLQKVCPSLFKDFRDQDGQALLYINKVQLWETENCYVEVTL